MLAKQHDEWAEARPKGKSGGTKFAQHLLRELIIARRTDVREEPQAVALRRYFASRRTAKPPPAPHHQGPGDPRRHYRNEIRCRLGWRARPSPQPID